MYRIRHEHIANEARHVYIRTQRQDDQANWHEAIDNLKIFPEQKFEMDSWDVRDVRGVFLASGNPLSFGYLYKSLVCLQPVFQKCREVFERNVLKSPQVTEIYHIVVDYKNYHYRKGFFVQPSPGTELRVPHFIRNIELDKLNLSELTTFKQMKYGGQDIQCVLITPSSFWTACEMRFSLFTILVRAGRHYYFNSIEDALEQEPHAEQTMSAIRMFFDGRVNCVLEELHWRTKWVGCFSGKYDDEIKQLLVA